MITPSSTRVATHSQQELPLPRLLQRRLSGGRSWPDSRYDGLKARNVAILTNNEQAYSTGFRDEFERLP